MPQIRAMKELLKRAVRPLQRTIGIEPLAAELDALLQSQLRSELDGIRQKRRARSSKSLLPYGYKVYSQTDEDGLIAEIFNRIGTTNRVFAELGVGHGLENNTAALLASGWRGGWVECDSESVARIRAGLPRLLGTRLRLVHESVTRENIDKLLVQELAEREIDLLSIDIDGNDWHVFESLRLVKPRVVVIEYNAKFPPPLRFCMDYAADHRWNGDDYQGASLAFLVDGFAEKGYQLIGCNASGGNAFFVRDDLAGDHFDEPSTAEHLYEPPRYHLIRLRAGHPAAYRTLEAAALASGR